jgi:NAD(P)H-dependent FMN reductase
MTRILGISGSLRTASLNTALLRTIEAMALPGIELDLVTLHGIPLYDGDLEARDGLPAAVVALKDKVANADAVLLATPEYNNGIPGVFKNAIDWLSRTSPVGNIPSVFGGRPFALIGASPGGFGTILSQNHWLPVLKTLGVQLWAGNKLMVSRAGSVFDADGNLVDDKVREQLAGFVQGFAAFAAR